MDMTRLTQAADFGFASLYHHDGRFIRRQGVFAFSRRDADGGHTVLHIESVADISRAATSGHRMWDWAVSNGMNELLVNMTDATSRWPAIPLSDLRFSLHPDAAAPGLGIAA